MANNNIQRITNEQLLDEIEQWLESHGKVQDVQYSEIAYLHRVRSFRTEIARQEALYGQA